ncbi:unnamed protein product [Rotaria magnacalcarata]
MKYSYSSSIPPTPATRKCRSAQQHGIDQNKIQLPRLIAYSTLHDNIIWLDLFVNERNLTFAKDMIAASRLLVSNAASDCIDFLGSCRQQCSLTTMRDIYSVIISGNLCNEYTMNHKIGCSYHWNIYHNGAFTNLIESTKRKRSSSFETSDEISSDSDHNSSIRRVTFPDITQTNQLNDKQLIENTNDTSPAQNNVFSSFDDLSSSHKQKSKPIESSPDHLNDVSGRKELEQINENVILLNELLDDCQTSDDDVYDQIENEALALMLQCDELIDVSPAVKSARRQTIHNMQEILNKIDCKVTLQKSQTNGAMYSISV